LSLTEHHLGFIHKRSSSAIFEIKFKKEYIFMPLETNPKSLQNDLVVQEFHDEVLI